MGWREHILRTTVLTGRVIGVKGNGSIYTFPSGREQAGISPDWEPEEEL